MDRVFSTLRYRGPVMPKIRFKCGLLSKKLARLRCPIGIIARSKLLIIQMSRILKMITTGRPLVVKMAILLRTVPIKRRSGLCAKLVMKNRRSSRGCICPARYPVASRTKTVLTLKLLCSRLTIFSNVTFVTTPELSKRTRIRLLVILSPNNCS